MYAHISEDEIHSCHTEVQDRQALIVRTNRVQIPTDELRSDEFLRKEIRKSFLKEVAFEMGKGRIFTGWGSEQVGRTVQLYGFPDLSDGLGVGHDRAKLGNWK